MADEKSENQSFVHGAGFVVRQVVTPRAVLMDDTELLRQVLNTARASLNLQTENFKLQFLEYWSREMKKPRYADPKRLLRHGYKIYSQNDEDGIIGEIFHRIGHGERRFVEFGVQNGFECNTAKLLIEGWHGLWIEAQPKFVQDMGRRFQSFIENDGLVVVEQRVTAENINFTGKPGVAQDRIDIDYNDYWVWRAIDAVRPRVVVIEYNCSLRPPLSLVVPYDPNQGWTGGNYFGASLGALVKLGRSKGYRIVGCCFAGVNAFFVREDLCGDHFVEPSTAEEHYEPERYFTRYMPSGHRGKPGYFESV